MKRTTRLRFAESQQDGNPQECEIAIRQRHRKSVGYYEVGTENLHDRDEQALMMRIQRTYAKDKEHVATPTLAANPNLLSVDTRPRDAGQILAAVPRPPSWGAPRW
jgi:hypothetical protein